MAEVLANMVVGSLVSMVKEKASSYLLDQYKVMEGMEEQHKLLKRKLPAILDVITDAEEQAAKNREGAKAWLEELREVAYRANDVLDEFKYEALRRKARAEGHYKEFGMDVIKLFPSHNRFVFRYRMANKLHVILQEIDVLIAEMNTFRFKFKPQPTISLKWRQTDPNIPDHFFNIASESRAKEKEEIVDALLHQGGNVGLTVLPIVGMGGMGKTTLAQLVYNDTAIQKHFQLRLWVCVSENFDVYPLVERILKEAEENGCKAYGTSVVDKLKSVVSGKRYLLVLDDVWNRKSNKWKMLRSYLRDGSTGSSVVTTTRDENVAQIMGTIKDHKIKGLDERFIKEIIKTGAFGSAAEMPKEYEKMVGDIANRCKGSPLAATALGSVLHTKNTVQEWEDVLSRNTICDEETGILPILKLSYNCLPPHMRQCFAFCAMFPKDHEIDVEMLIRLWMANCFIPEKKGVCPELTGKQIFNELAQRLFFQEVKQVKFGIVMYSDKYRYRSRTTCKIHDLMHDVAQDSMGKECATVDTELSQSEGFPYSARHLFLSVDIPGNVLDASLQKGFTAIQTLICDGLTKIEDVHGLSKYMSVRALTTRQGSFLEPKYLHHIRYLDLSGSDIKALPKDITIMYHLQTLNLSNCRSLEQLPKAMRYMTVLRHLYTHGCDKLKGMPPDLGHLTSLQTLTCFVAGTSTGCSNMGELEKLDLGGQLELRQLENVGGRDAKAANLENKKRLEELTLRWTQDGEKEEAHKEVLEGLRPHDGLKLMRMHYYGSSAIPKWMLQLQGLVDLELWDCQHLEELPALWQLPALQSLLLWKLENVSCLFSCGAPSKFKKLKRMDLLVMPKFEAWWDMNEVQVEELIFPEVEELFIYHCGRLTALPKASVVKQSSSGGDGPECRSAFPALREMSLVNLKMFHRWEAVEGTQGESVAFPQLEKLIITDCSDQLTTFPEAPKLSTLELRGCSQEASQQAASRYIDTLSRLVLYASADDSGRTLQAEQNLSKLVAREFLLGDLALGGCDLFFSQSSSLMALWKGFIQLASLIISGCNSLVYWPEKVFQCLVSLRTLEIWYCNNMTGLTEEEASDEPSSSAPERRRQPLPRLESLVIRGCESLVQVPNLSASLKMLCIMGCNSLKSMVFLGEQEETTRLQVSGQDVVQPADMSGSLIVGSSSQAMVFTDVLEPVTSSSADNTHYCSFPCLEIRSCGRLSEVVSLPLSIKTVNIIDCGSLASLLGKVPLLEELEIWSCRSLEFLPDDEPQAYSSLRVLVIQACGIKLLPPKLEQRLDHLDKKELDCHLQGPVEPPVPSRRNAALMSKLVCFNSIKKKSWCASDRRDRRVRKYS